MEASALIESIDAAVNKDPKALKEGLQSLRTKVIEAAATRSQP